MEQRLRQALLAIQGIKIPDLPKEIIELNSELACKFPNNQNITRIIEGNTKLSGEVLKIANSPVMKLKNPVKTIREAVDALGSENIKNLVIAAALKNIFDNPQIQEVMDHATDVAFCCAELSENIADITRDEAYLAGLFHNGGCLMLASKDPSNYLKIFSHVNTHPVSGVQKEMDNYQTNHMDVGLLLGQRWKLPLETLNAILLHHTEELSLKSERLMGMVSMLKIANVIVNEVSYGAYMTNEANQYLNSAREDLMISKEDVNTVRRALIAFA